MSLTPRSAPRTTHSLPAIYIVRHGATAWSVTGQHTGRTDLPLTEQGERNALRIGDRLHGHDFRRVWTSPLQRARQTCELAGFATPEVDKDLVEWDYGQYEGLTTPEILQHNPDWQLFRDGCPGGEKPADVAGRADRVIERVRRLELDALLFASGHILRVLAARWLGFDASFGRYLALDTATISILSYEHTAREPVIRLWNESCRHVQETPPGKEGSA